MIKVVNDNQIFGYEDLNASELSYVCMAVSVLKIREKNFIPEIADRMKAKLEELNEFDLFQLAKSSFFFRQLLGRIDFYEAVHRECVARLRSGRLEHDIIDKLKEVY
jgi:hypothetical protein